uniref:Uncharacterized protein n=1 Tax=Oryza punctata TaxID=4537 RepID=A0A0E0KTX2_ORYPU
MARAFRSAIQKHMALCNCQSKWPLFSRLNKVNRPKQQCRFVNCKWRISYLQLGVGSIINLEKYEGIWKVQDWYEVQTVAYHVLS